MRIYSIYILLCLISFSACQNRREKEIKQFITSWEGKEIILPSSWQDARDSLWETAIHKRFKIFTYVDTNGCTECQLKLYDWERLHKKLDSLDKNATILYIVHNKYPKYIESIKKRNNVTFPFFLDEENKIGKLNHLSSKLLYRTFLLDSTNKIILFGNPIQNEQIWNLYKQTITNKQKSITNTQ